MRTVQYAFQEPPTHLLYSLISPLVDSKASHKTEKCLNKTVDVLLKLSGGGHVVFTY